MARPRTYDDRVQRPIRLPRDLHAEAAAYAEARDLSFNLVVERALRAYLAKSAPPSSASWDWGRREEPPPSMPMTGT